MNKHEGSDFKKWSNEFVEELARENEKLQRENQELRALVEAKDKVIEAAQELSRLLDDTHPLVIALKALPLKF